MGNIADFQIHHILPIEIFNDYGLKIEEIMGDDKSLQSYNNRIALFKDSQMIDYYSEIKASGGWSEIPLGAVNHNGYHSNYNVEVGNKVKNILANPNLDLAGKKIAIIDLQEQLKQGMLSGELNIYDEKENIKSYIDQHTITDRQIIDKGEHYQLALSYEQKYIENDLNYPELKNEKILTDAVGKATYVS